MSEDRRQEDPLEEFLDRRSPLSSTYRDASADRPPAVLDEAILAASRRAVRSGPRRIGWARKWGTPLAAAAVLVLAVAVVLNLEDDPQIAQFKETRVPPAGRSDAGAKVKSSEPDAAELAVGKREEKAKTRDREAEERSAFVSQPAGPPGDARYYIGPVAPAVPSPGKRNQAPVESATAPKVGAAAQSVREQVAAPSPVSKAAGTEIEDGVRSDSLASRRLEEKAAELDEAAALRKQSAAAPSAATPGAAETRIEQINAHYAQGRTEEGDTALREFCRSFPAYALPEGLRGHAGRLGLDCAPRR